MKANRGIALITAAMAAFIIGSALAAEPKSTRTETDGPRNLSQTASPESAGFDPSRLAKLDAYMQGAVDQKRAAGISTLLARHGKIISFKTHGVKNLASGAPLTPDTIFRLASMTKPVTAVAMLILFEEGKWQLDDPVSRFIPEFKNLKVMTGVDSAGNPILEDPKHAPTMRELMSHSAGFTYGFQDTPVDKLARDKQIFAVSGDQDFINRIASLPLAFQPGTSWVYSPSPEIQGVIVQRLTGKSLGQFMQDRIFKPLKMTDTGFYAPPEKLNRVATVYKTNDKGGIDEVTVGFAGNVAAPPKFESGGGGLLSTTMDYARFAQMLANKGQLDGARILSPASVEMMGTNMLPHGVLVNSNGQLGIGFVRFNEAVGFGLNVMVALDPRAAGSLEGKGTFTWGGATSVWWWFDPTNDITFVLMTQLLGDNTDNSLSSSARTLTYQALVDPEK